jgi:hypothetical protein
MGFLSLLFDFELDVEVIRFHVIYRNPLLILSILPRFGTNPISYLYTVFVYSNSITSLPLISQREAYFHDICSLMLPKENCSLCSRPAKLTHSCMSMTYQLLVLE